MSLTIALPAPSSRVDINFIYAIYPIAIPETNINKESNKIVTCINLPQISIFSEILK